MVRKKITQTSITNNLILWLSITIGIILIIINSIYLYVISNQMNNQLQVKADKQAHNIAQILASPLWNMDINQITGIANAYLESEEVVKIIVYDQTIVDFEKILFQRSKEPENISFTLKKNILYDKKPIGLVEIAFTDISIQKDKKMIIISFILTGLSVLIILISLTQIILKKLLRKPIDEFVRNFNNIASGHYHKGLTDYGLTELKSIVDAANTMTRKIEKRDREINSAIKEIDNFREYFFNIINVMPSALISIDENLDITLLNQKARYLFNIATGKMDNPQLYHMVPRIKKFENKITDSLNNKNINVIKNQEIKTENEIYYEKITIYPFASNAQKGLILLFDDITNIVHMEQMMIQSEKMLSIGGLAAGMAHEINNPLAGMMQNANVVMNRLTKNLPKNIEVAEKCGVNLDDIKKYMEARHITHLLELIVKSGDHASEIVRSMLSFARSGPTNFVSQNLHNIIDETILLVQNDYNMKKNYDFKKIEFVKDYAESLPDIYCDKGQITQVLFNIFKNAAEAMAEIKESDFQSRIEIITNREENFIRLNINNNGPLIPQDTKNKIFDPFYTTKSIDKGTGLGLSVSYFIITQNHNGHISVESDANSGTTFVLQLPINQNQE